MKLVMAWIFSIITFLGVVSQASSSCHEKTVNEVFSNRTELSQLQKETVQHDDLDQGHHQDSGCHHNGSGCRNCHLGHCPFTLTPSIQVSVFDLNQILYFIKVSVIIYDFQTSLFRPPIA